MARVFWPRGARVAGQEVYEDYFARAGSDLNGQHQFYAQVSYQERG